MKFQFFFIDVEIFKISGKIQGQNSKTRNLSWINFSLSRVEHEKCFIISGPETNLFQNYEDIAMVIDVCFSHNTCWKDLSQKYRLVMVFIVISVCE